jgi:hypothetical protein
VNWNKALEAGGVVVSDEVSITIDVEAAQEPAAPPAAAVRTEVTGSGGSDARDPAGGAARSQRLRLARQPPFVLVRRVSRPRAHGVPQPARAQRGPRRRRRGISRHGHRDMEILSWVLAGGLTHRDSLGTGSTFVPATCRR